MAELVIGAVVTVLVEKLASGIISAPGVLSAEIHSKLVKWSDTLPLIQAVLVDAGNKHIQDNEHVQLWLNKLHHLAYEIDDILDDLVTEATRHQLNKESYTSSSKVIKFIPNKLHMVKYNHKMSSKLDGITTKLLDLVNQKQLLGLTDGVKPSLKASGQVEETSLIDESEIMGREGDKEALLGKLLGGESSSDQAQNVNVVSIVGLGGIGKTTLARLLYNDDKVKGHFELRSWVCVSDVFDVFNISKAIYIDVGGKDRKFETLNQLQVALSEKLLMKRFLLVLDDVWSDNYKQWEILKRPFTVGAAGSKVLVTTRKSMVASVMDSVVPYSLELLSHEEALSLFSLHASGSQNFDVNQVLKLHGKDIIEKCGRLPLALKALGRVFRTKSNVEEWEELLNSEIWNSHNESTVLSALKLSYYDLPPHLKQMFEYCCLYPKDYMFDKDELVLLWMAEGFLYKSNGNKSMESFGHECFDELLSRSFFQHLTGDNSQYMMHDLINDLATSVAGEFFLMLDDETDVQARIKTSDKLRHLSFISEREGTHKKFKALMNCKHLRTYLAISLRSTDKFYVSTNVLLELLPQSQFLRVFSLAGYSKIKGVPQSVCSLKHLRYLNFSKTEITCLPQQVGDLLNLQSLLVSGCKYLSSLPYSLAKLINLRHLNFSNTSIRCLPEQVGDLHNLQSLLGSDCYYLYSLPNSLVKLINLRHLNFSNTSIECLPEQVGDLINLQSLLVSGCRNLTSFPNSFLKLINLRHLDISHTKNLNKMSLGITGFSGLQNLSKFVTGKHNVFGISDLKGQLNLQGELSIKRLQEVKDPGQAKEANLQQMKGVCYLSLKWDDKFDDSRIEATEYEVLEGLRPSEKLGSLEILYYGGTEFPSWVGDPSFVCLTKLTLRGCKSCKHLPALGQLASLRELCVEGMDVLERLDFKFPGRFNSCQGISFPSLEVLKFKDMKSWEKWSTSGGDIAVVFPCLRELSMIGCKKLDAVSIELISPLWKLHVTGCSLKKLEIFRCNNFVSLGEKEVQCVTDVKISSCERLERYNCPSSIENLKINDCKSLTSLSFPTMDEVPSTLKYINIDYCDSLEVSWPANNFLSSLEHLLLKWLPNLRLFPEGCLAHLTELKIVGCDNIESILDNGYDFLPSCCLKRLEISRCKNLKSFPYKYLETFASLEQMAIWKCPSLDDSFPCGLWPPNLRELKIGGLKKPITSEWGFQNFPTSLVQLYLVGGEKDTSRVVTFEKGKAGVSDTINSTSSFLHLLPSSLTELAVHGFKELESVREGLQHLTCLQHLNISRCPKVRDLPETILPSLSSLALYGDVSRELKIKCSREGEYWPIISQIPHLLGSLRPFYVRRRRRYY